MAGATTRDWLVPLAAGGIAFAVMLLVPAPGDGKGDAHDGEPEGPGEDLGFRYAFAPPYVVRDGNDSAQVLLLSRDAQAVGDDGHGTTWRTPHVAFQQSSSVHPDCGGPWPCHPAHEAAGSDAPRLFADGHNATRVTVHIFDESGRLIASNAPASERSGFTDGDGAEDLPAGVWYLGAKSPAPNGTQRPPQLAMPFVNGLRASLAGLPEGGVASMQSNAFVVAYGTLFATVRIDELVHEP